MKIHVYEKAFLWLGGIVLIVFLAALGYAAVGLGMNLPSRGGEIDPTAIRTTPPFDAPGVRRTGTDTYEVVMYGGGWSFVPNQITVPAGAEVNFILTSADVVHGFNIEGTRVNVMLVPGQITRLTYTFAEPGEHLLICHEYCGVNHHLMSGRVIVE